MTLPETGVFTHFGGCDIIAHFYGRSEIMAEVGGITWMPGPDHNYQGGINFVNFDYPSTVDMITAPDKFWVEISFVNEYGETYAAQFMDVQINERILEKGKVYRFYAKQKRG